MRTIFAILVLSVAGLAQGIMEPWQIPCKQEAVTPNLLMKTNQRIFGQLKDASGAPFEKSKVLLRKQTTKGDFVDYRTAVTDSAGRFDLRVVELGKYRFLPAPNRGFKQPRQLMCPEGRECEINLVLQVGSTDESLAGCPVQ